METTEQQLQTLAKESLGSFMEDISEDVFAAGWMQGLEYDLWGMVRGYRNRHYGMSSITDEQVAKLALLAQQSGGWWQCGEFVPLNAWRKEYARWFEQEHLPSMRRWPDYLRGKVGEKDIIGRVTTLDDVAAAEKELAEDEARLETIKREAL